MNKQLSVKEVIAILEPIPEDQFIIGAYKLNGKCCTIGYIYKYLNNNEDFHINSCTVDIFDAQTLSLKSRVIKYTKENNLLNIIHKYPLGIIDINDGYGNSTLLGNTPKQRVMKLFNDMLSKGYEIIEA